MSVDATKLVIPGHGTVFTAAVNVKPPTNPLTAFGLTTETVGTGGNQWKNLGHTSKDNTIAFTKEGGEKETIDTFLADSVRTTTAATKWGVTIAALQFDETVLGLAFNGDFDSTTGGYIVAGASPVDIALFLFFQDTTGSLGFWLPNVNLSAGDAPTIDTTKFLELSLSGTIQSAPSGTIPAVNGRAGVFEIFKTGLVDPTP